MAGVRIVDLTIAAAGPLATEILEAQGAEVIKVERPDGGDFMRTQGTMAKGVGACFASWNRGKKSVCIDLKRPEGVALVKILVADADVFVHNLRGDNAEAMGLGYEALREVRPDIVYAVLTGWGETGPRTGDPAYDSVMQAASGIAMQQADRATGAPQFVQNAICDKVSGLTFAQLLTAALYERARSGKGQRLHLSMLHASLAYLWPDGMQTVAFLDGDDSGGRIASTPPLRRTADGWMSISAMLDHEFLALCRVLEVPEVATDPRWNNAGDRSRNADALWALVNPLLARWTTAELARRLREHRVPHAVVAIRQTIHDDPQVLAIGALETLQDPDAGRMRFARAAGDFSRTPLASPGAAPRLGGDTDAVLRAAGVRDEEISRLRTRQVIA